MPNPSIGDTPIVPTTRKVNNKTMEIDIDISKSDVGLGNVDNTSDMGKPVSTAQATSIATKMTTPTGNASQVVLGNGTLGTLPVVPTAQSSTYQALVSQSGTSAPSAVQSVNDFTGTTFAWARTGTGTYTLTASNPVFTAGKTAVIMSNPNAFLNNFKYANTSTSIITFQTATLSVISLLLTPGNADSLLANTMAYVVVYP